MIVVIIVCRIYFPEALQSRVTPAQQRSAARNYNYRVAEEQLFEPYGDDDEEDYGSEDDDEDGVLAESGEEVLDSSSDEQEGEGGSPTFLEFQQESLSRKKVLQRLIFCCIMLNITFVTWGALQVRSCQKSLRNFA